MFVRRQCKDDFFLCPISKKLDRKLQEGTLAPLTGFSVDTLFGTKGEATLHKFLII